MRLVSSHRSLRALAAGAGLFSVAAYAAGVSRHGRFEVTVKRSEKTAAPGGAVKYALRVNRTAATRGPVRMAVGPIPPGVRVQWRRQGRLVGDVMRRGGRKIRLRLV